MMNYTLCFSLLSAFLFTIKMLFNLVMKRVAFQLPHTSLYVCVHRSVQRSLFCGFLLFFYVGTLCARVMNLVHFRCTMTNDRMYKNLFIQFEVSKCN